MYEAGLFFLRLAVAVIFIYHAVPKLRDPKGMASAMGWAHGQILGLGILEFMSAVAVLSGVATRFGAMALMIVMAGAIYHKINKWHVPFFATTATGWEFDFLLFAASLTIYLS